MISRRSKPLGVGLFVCLCLLFLFYYDLEDGSLPSFGSLHQGLGRQRHSTGRSKLIAKPHADEKTPALDGKTGPRRTSIHNETLGFEKIFVINLPERPDKRDAISLMGSLTGLKFEFITGVRGKEVVDKARPFGYDAKHIKDNHLGSWRGHMNAIRSMLEQGLSSALILEDDVDWDANIKDQFRHFASGSRHISSSKPHTPTDKEPPPYAFHDAGPTLQDSFDDMYADAPYGDSWDVLWLGHCGEIFPPNDDRLFYIKKDKTVPPYENFKGWFDPRGWPEGTRFIHPTNAPVCTFAYALSRAGAQKILFQQSVDGLPAIFDNGLSDMCRDRTLGLNCVSVAPPMIVHHRPRGREAADSDINTGGDNGDRLREIGYTENIVYSVRLNLARLLRGEEAVSQWSPEMAEEHKKAAAQREKPKKEEESSEQAEAKAKMEERLLGKKEPKQS